MSKVSSKLILILEVVFVGLVVAVIAAQANPLYQIPNRDSGFFMYTGSQILKGKLLYVDVWDNKGPMIFYMNAFALWLGHGSRWGVWAMEYVSLFLGAFFGFKLMHKLWGGVSAIFGTVVWLFAFNLVMRGGNFTEEYSLAFGFISMYVFWLCLQDQQNRLYPVIIGMILALNFLLRANNIGVQLSIILVLILSGILDKAYLQSLKQLLWIGFGTLLVFAFVAIYFQTLGTLDDMIQSTISYNFFYTNSGSGVSNLPVSFIRGINLLGYSTSLVALLGYVVLIEKLPESIRSGSTPFRNMNFLFLIGFPVEVALSSLSGKNFSHYYICWTPYIGLFCGLLLGLNERLKKPYTAILMAMLVLISVTNLTLLDQYQTAFTKLLFNRSSGIELIHPVAKYIRDNTLPSDTVLVWGSQPYINVMAQRDSPIGILFYPEIESSPFTDGLNAKYYQELVQNKPALIVDMVDPNNDTIPFIDPVQQATQEQRLKRFDPPSNLEQVFDFIYKNYHVETIINKVVIYRLNIDSQ